MIGMKDLIKKTLVFDLTSTYYLNLYTVKYIYIDLVYSQHAASNLVKDKAQILKLRTWIELEVLRYCAEVWRCNCQWSVKGRRYCQKLISVDQVFYCINEK